ncbi:MAG: PLP-dependent transferase [Actinomycetes bacterium]|nr:PLP-dependent transferase [Candidatus Nanopelagicales bacterium]
MSRSSLGGVDILAQHPAALTHRPLPDGARPTDDIIRFPIGLESVEDLIVDISQALKG